MLALYVWRYKQNHPFPAYAQKEEIEKREGLKNRDDRIRRILNSKKKVLERRDDHFEMLKRIWLNKPLRDA